MTFQEWVQEKIVIDGLISINKPYGIPSTALTDMYKIVTGSKVGHGGTLDPLAQGAMLLGIGSGTKLLTKYLESEKRYRASILIGASSDSGDLELPIIIPELQFSYTEESVKKIFEELAKGFTQELPALNASKQNGKTAYSLVREGKPTEKRFIETKLLEWKILEQKALNAEELHLAITQKVEELRNSFATFEQLGGEIGYHSRRYDFMLEKWMNSLAMTLVSIFKESKKTYLLISCDVLVPKGTYIRSLASDIASRLDSVGMLLGLERISAGRGS